MTNDAEAHVLERIAAAPVRREPFAHCVVDGVFPADFYEEIIDHWPQEESWAPLAESGRVRKDTYAERMVVLMDPAGLARLDEARRAFWRDRVGAWLLGRALREHLLRKFAADLVGTDFAAT